MARGVAHVQPEARRSLDELREHALRAGREHAHELSFPLDGAHTCERGRPFREWRGLAVDRQRDQGVGAERLLQLGRAAERERLAIVDDRDPFAELVRLIHVVRREQRRLPSFVQVAQDAPEVDAGLWVDPRGRLVEEEHLGLVHERASDHQPLRESARKLEHHRLRSFGERELLEQLVGAQARPPPRHAEETAVVVEVLPHGQRAVECVRLRDDTDAPLYGCRVVSHVQAGDQRPPARRHDDRGQHPDRRRLAGAVRAEQPEELAAAHLEVEAVHRDHGLVTAPVDLPQLLGPDRRFSCRRRNDGRLADHQTIVKFVVPLRSTQCNSCSWFGTRTTSDRFRGARQPTLTRSSSRR